MTILPEAFFTQKFQDGGRIPEVVKTLQQKTIKVISAAAAMF